MDQQPQKAKVATVPAKRKKAGNKGSKLPRKRKGKHKAYRMGEDALYGILDERNINQVQFGVDKRFQTWYGTNVYFDTATKKLGYLNSSSSAGNSNSDSGVNTPNNNTSGTTDPDELERGRRRGTRNNGVIVHSNQDTVQTRDDSREGDDEEDDDDDDDDQEEPKIWLDTLYVCEYCFKYTDNEELLVAHADVCPFKLHTPPGRIKYKSPEYTIRRVKGAKHELFCQCLCLFTKLFLDNKSMYFKVDHYEFYILYETNKRKPLGFFFRDLLSYNQNNLACILVFPPYQRRQLGSLLIEFSYRLSRQANVVSGPELPLSPFGLISYLKYWSQIICWELIEGQLSEVDRASLQDVSEATGLRISDIIMTLKYLGCIGEKNQVHLQVLKDWLREHGRAGRDSFEVYNNSTFMLQDEYLLLND